MIRVGPSSSFSAKLNKFHSLSSQSTGLYTNTSSVVPALPTDRFAVDVETQISQFPVNMAGQTAFIGVLDRTLAPQTVSDVYVTITKVSGGFTAVKESGYTGFARTYVNTESVSFQFGTPLTLIGDVLYLRLDNVQPTPHTYAWYNGASGNANRDLVAIDTSVAIFNPATRTISASVVGGTFDIVKLDANDNMSFICYLNRTTFNLTNTSYSTSWSGSSLGNGPGGFHLIVALPSSGV